ncbi:hypothetical protein SK128_024169 [Halocaridina rubra]|uniref:Uncharacterized protein n=1 Tax=Halocaridina rubra TaxID=373956 RepID=A0AAN8WL37_HALRR
MAVIATIDNLMPSHTCDSTNLSYIPHYNFVMDLADKNTQHLLPAETEQTFNKAVDIATAHEASFRDKHAMGEGKCLPH